MFEKFNRRDGFGNVLSCDEAGNLTITNSNGSTRSIGMLTPIDGDPIKGFIYSKSVSEKHIFRKNNSFSINDYILRNIGERGLVQYSMGGGKMFYTIEAEFALEIGSYLWFKDEGFEKQVFVPLTFWRCE